MSLINEIEIPNELWCGIHQTGSSVICNPPVTDTDIDYVICANDIDKLFDFLIIHNFKHSIADGNEYDLDSSGMYCLRRNNINLILIDDVKFYKKWISATKLATKLNLLKKDDRIALFRFILYGIIDGGSE